MGYICLILQILFYIGTFYPRDPYLSRSLGTYKVYILMESIIQIMCLFINIVFSYRFKNYMVYVLIIDILLSGLVGIICSLCGKKRYFERLDNILLKDDLYGLSSNEIRKFILKEYGLLYFVEEIEEHISKCIRKI